MGERLRDGDRPGAGLAVALVPRLEQQGEERPEDQQHDQRHLQDEDLPGDAAWVPFGQ
ncbi:hypothetical protein [Streptomyces somaliensis]|uniref:hypothetical protein n=1 Tax=Streptomyces somaliensis TaxID=78355 RepID=UPI0034E94D4B|nr:hypothetical protein [Streptomyces somaliensis]